MRLVAGAALLSFAVAGIAGPAESANVKFTDVTASAGIHFVHNAGKAGKKYLPETLGSGAAFIDMDGDGWIDILLINSKDWTARGRKSLCALYRNNHNGTFTEITAGSGLDVEMYGIGVSVGDYDNDGRDDIYITALEGDHLFHNEGGGRFRDVTKSVKGPNKRKRLHAGKIAHQRLKTTPINTPASSQNVKSKNVQNQETDSPALVATNFVFPVTDRT